MMRKLFFTLFLVSCSVKPHYSQPETAVPETYRFAPENISEYVNFAWWEQFQDPVLAELIRTALKYNQNLQTATATVNQYYAKYQVAFSQLFPQINVQADAQRNKLPTNTPPVYSFFQLFGNLAYELDFWGKLRSSAEAAHASYMAQVNSRFNVILSIVSALAKGYILLLQYDDQLRVAQKTSQSFFDMWKIAKLRFEAGVISEMDLKQAEAQMEDAQVLVKTYEGLIPVQEDLISILLGAAPAPIPRGKSLAELQIPEKIPAGLPSDLLANRPDILQAEQNLISANAQIGVARAQLLPQFLITGRDGQEALQLHNLLRNLNNFFNSQLEVLEPIYTGGSLTGQLHETEAFFLANLHTYQQTVLNALQEVSDGFINYQTSQKVLEVQKKEINALEEYVRLSKLRYFNGQTDYLTVENSQQTLFAVELSAETTQGTVLASLVDIYTALGQGWDVEADYCEKCADPSPVWEAIFP